MTFTKRNLQISLLLSLLSMALILPACQALFPPAVQSVPTALATRVPSTAVATATKAPTPSPTIGSQTLWIDPDLPEELKSTDWSASGLQITSQKEQADLFFESCRIGQKYLRQDGWVYVLAAPFFTVQDSITHIQLMQILNARADSQNNPPIRIKARESDFAPIHKLLGKSGAGFAIQALDENLIGRQPEPEDASWLLIPFHLLNPFWKVISIDGVNPLDDDFKPEKYLLSLKYGLRLNDPTREAEAPAMPSGNFQPDQLTSLIMTGVTAMARDTAYEMEIQGVLFPGTEIRDVMRAADLTHISNEVSFYEGCKFPDPDYMGFIFCSNPAYIDLIEDMGADIIELTGNHNNDVQALYKVDSVPFTLNLYEERGMRWYAGGTNLANATAPLKIEHNGNKLAFIGCNSYGPEMAWATQDGSGAAPCQDFAWLKAAIFNLRQEGYLPIVTLQYQEDYFQEATNTAIRDFRPLAEAGAVIVNGSQSHVAKAMEFYGGAFVHYGLGNLFFDQPEFYITYDSFIQKHFFYQGRHLNTQLLTITVEETAKPRFMTIEEREGFLSEIFGLSQDLRSKQ